HDVGPRDAADRRDARSDRLAFDDDHAGSALPESAAELRSAQLEVVAEDVQKRRRRVDIQCVRSTVYFDRNSTHRHPLVRLKPDATSAYSEIRRTRTRRTCLTYAVYVVSGFSRTFRLFNVPSALTFSRQLSP